jgi:hypothetical protein
MQPLNMTIMPICNFDLSFALLRKRAADEAPVSLNVKRRRPRFCRARRQSPLSPVTCKLPRCQKTHPNGRSMASFHTATVSGVAWYQSTIWSKTAGYAHRRPAIVSYPNSSGSLRCEYDLLRDVKRCSLSTSKDIDWDAAATFESILVLPFTPNGGSDYSFFSVCVDAT